MLHLQLRQGTRLWSVATFLLWSVNLFAALTRVETKQIEEEFSRRLWLRENGLPDNRVHTLLQTQDGYLWIGTPRGLVRFDGVAFAIFDHLNTPQLSSDDCRTLAEDTEGNLWVGTRQGIVCKRPSGFIRLTGKQAAHLDSIVGPPLCSRGEGGIWVGGNNCIYSIQRQEVTRYQGNFGQTETGGTVTAIDEAPSGDVLLGTGVGLVRFAPKTESFEVIPGVKEFRNVPAVALQRLSENRLLVLFSRGSMGSLKGGESWLATYEDGRWFIDPTTKYFITDSQTSPFMVKDRKGAIWMPGPANGLNCWERDRFLTMPILHQGSNDMCQSACVDRDNNLWVGTIASGLQRWIPRKVQTYTTDDGLAHDNVWTICEARDGRVWIGTDGGVTCFENGQFTKIAAPADSMQSHVRSIIEDRAGAIWVGTMRSLERIENGKSVEVTLPGNWEDKKTRVLLGARDGSIWIGGLRGLTRFQDGKLTKYTKAEGLGSDEARALLEARSGAIWIGTLAGGLSCFQAGKITTLTTSNGLSNNNVWSLYEDGEGALWIGTENGLDRLQNNRMVSFSKTHGLPAYHVNSILEDNFGRLWISHDHGIYWVKKKQLNDVAEGRAQVVRAVNYDESDGLLSIETNGQKSNPTACKTRDGRLWYATTKGVAIFDPAKVLTDHVPPLTVIERIRANGQIVFDNGPAIQTSGEETPRSDSTNGASTIKTAPRFSQIREGQSTLWEVPPGKARVLEFHYAANTFVAPEKTRFKYRLLGLDNHWINASARREVFFTDLRPGDYQFEVMACDHHGVWPDRGTITSLRLLPFFYQTWWFYAGSGALLTALAIGTFTWRVREVRRIHELERINALNEQRKQIARDIHDELGASLTHIIQMSGNSSEPDFAPNHKGGHHDRIRETAEQAVDNISEILWVTNPDYDTLEDLVTYLREYAATFFELSPVSVQFDFPEALPPLKVSGLFRRHLLMLVKEALQNVMKHALATKVRITLRQDNGHLQLCIADDGRGLTAKGADKRGNGLSNMSQRVTELNGHFELVSPPGWGTEVRVRVPLADASG